MHFISRPHRSVVALVCTIVFLIAAIAAWSIWNRPRVIEPVAAVALGNVLPTQDAVPQSCVSEKDQALNLNTATKAELEELPGVGPVMAQRIVQWRERHGRFSDIRELREIEGIGEKVFAKISALVTT